MDDQRIGYRPDGIAQIHKAPAIRAQIEEAIEVACQMRGHLTPLLERMARDDGDFVQRFRRSMLTSVVDAAMEISGADMGNLQLFDSAIAALRIEAQCGFSQPFLEFFDCVHDGQAACGTAFGRGEQVIVEDVADSPIFLGSPALEVMLDAGARAVQSTPLIGRSGCILGMISTHKRRPWRPSQQDSLQLRLLARNAAEWIQERMYL